MAMRYPRQVTVSLSNVDHEKLLKLTAKTGQPSLSHTVRRLIVDGLIREAQSEQRVSDMTKPFLGEAICTLGQLETD